MFSYTKKKYFSLYKKYIFHRMYKKYLFHLILKRISFHYRTKNNFYKILINKRRFKCTKDDFNVQKIFFLI